MSHIKVGDTVRHADFQLFPGTDMRTTQVLSIDQRIARLKGSPCSYFIDHLVVVPTEPEPAEEGVYIAVRLDAEGKPIFPPSTTPTQFKYWVDAERNLEECLKTLPRERFGVLKLVATVSNQPVWS